MDPDAPQPTLQEWLKRLGEVVDGEPGVAPISVEEQRLLLDLARVAAHTSERVAAPISTYLLGLAMAALPPDRRAAELERILRAIEANG